eukprot:UN19099
MDKVQVPMLFHALWCLYFRKHFKSTQLPEDSDTTDSCELFTTAVFDRVKREEGVDIVDKVTP